MHKNAKAASLRAAFPEEMGNDYTAEEMEGKETDGGVVIEARAEPVQHEQDPPREPETFLEKAEQAIGRATNSTQL